MRIFGQSKIEEWKKILVIDALHGTCKYLQI